MPAWAGTLRGRCVRSPALPLFSFSLCILHSALCTLDSRSPFPVPRSRRCLFASSYPQRRTPKSACQKPSNSSRNRSKRRRFPSKSDQKGAHFVMPILTFWWVTPSGASAKAVFAFRKGKKARFGGAKWRPEKLSTIRKSYPQFQGRGGQAGPPLLHPAGV